MPGQLIILAIVIVRSLGVKAANSQLNFWKLFSLLSWWGATYVPGNGKTLAEPIYFIADLFSIPAEKSYVEEPAIWLVYVLLAYLMHI